MTDQTHRTVFKANPVQQRFIESRAAADLFASRVGEGKSAALAWSTYYHTKHNPGANWLIIRDTYENLRRTTLKEFFNWFPPGVYGTWNETKKEWRWASGIADGTVSFTGMENPDDVSKLLSWELGGFAIDEPAPAIGSGGVSAEVFDLAMTRLRQPGMKWYPAKLATNNPDELHWTYQKFVSPGTPNYELHQPNTPENIANLPAGYYERVRAALSSRPDLIRRFVDGEFGFQQEGKAVTPQWNDKVHLGLGLVPIPRRELILLWDFGHNPTCIVTQVTPLGHWLILDSMVGEGIGTVELIADSVKPLLLAKYPKHPLRHIGDPAGLAGDQSSIQQSPVRAIKNLLGGPWKSGPIKIPARIEPLRAVLSRMSGGEAVVRVDRENAKEVWQALRGGWHYHVARTGVTSADPVKDKHSHPGDAMGYGAAVLFPLAKIMLPPTSKAGASGAKQTPSYFGSGGAIMPDEDEGAKPWRIGPDYSGKVPHNGDKI